MAQIEHSVQLFQFRSTVTQEKVSDERGNEIIVVVESRHCVDQHAPAESPESHETQAAADRVVWKKRKIESDRRPAKV